MSILISYLNEYIVYKLYNLIYKSVRVFSTVVEKTRILQISRKNAHSPKYNVCVFSSIKKNS